MGTEDVKVTAMNMRKLCIINMTFVQVVETSLNNEINFSVAFREM